MEVESVLGNFAKMWCAKRGMILAKYASSDRKAILRHVVRLRASGQLLQNPADACQLVSALRATIHLDGDIAEVGTAAGGSARLISEYCGDKTIHLFDTFEGLPKPGDLDGRFSEGSYRSSLEDVQRYLEGRRVEFHKGMFPGSATSVQGHRFSFVHLDVDLYQSTLDCLRFFYPRLNPGGIIITHDYSWAAGVDQAFSEFFADKLEKPIELIGYQAMVVKLS
jgi:predicted O-methyltransferase YrrM